MLLTSGRIFYFISHRYFTALAFLGNTLEYFQSSLSIKNRLCSYVLKIHAEKPTACCTRYLMLEDAAHQQCHSRTIPTPQHPLRNVLVLPPAKSALGFLIYAIPLFGTRLNYNAVGGERLLAALLAADAAPRCPGSRAVSAVCPGASPRLIRHGGPSEVSPVQTKQNDRAL